MELVDRKPDPYVLDVAGLQKDYTQYPRSVSIETLVLCNAKCGFCPYPDSPRKDQRMSSELFYKIIDDLRRIPKAHEFDFTLARINEPLLDKRLKEFSLHVQEMLPNARQSIWSNGTTIKKQAIEWISELKDASYSISLNSMDKKDHKEIMGLPLEPVLKRLDYLHDLRDKGLIDNEVFLYAPYLTEEKAKLFVESVEQRFPLFTIRLRPVYTWVGGSEKGNDQRLTSEIGGLIARKSQTWPCGQWFDLNILANGYATKCCIDETGFDEDAFNAAKNHCLDIFAKTLPYRQELPSRSTVPGCEGCTHPG